MDRPITLTESAVSTELAGKSINFLVDTGAAYSALSAHGSCIYPSWSLVMGIEGTPSKPLQVGCLPYSIKRKPSTHSFLVIPSCPTPLLG